MIVYNVTIKVQQQIANEWLQWLKNIHILEVMQSECFTSYKILQLLEVDEAEGPTFAIQYFAESKASYNRYIEKFATILREKSFERWGNKFIAFRTIMQCVE